MIDTAVFERHRNNTSGAGALGARDGARGPLSQAASTLNASSRDDVKPIMLTARNHLRQLTDAVERLQQRPVIQVVKLQ
jgi:hypothetical protein